MRQSSRIRKTIAAAVRIILLSLIKSIFSCLKGFDFYERNMLDHSTVVIHDSMIKPVVPDVAGNGRIRWRADDNMKRPVFLQELLAIID